MMTKILMIMTLISITLLIYVSCGTKKSEAETPAPEKRRSASTPFDVPTHWIADWEEAVLKSKSEKKPIMAIFSGSDWCPPCQRLSKNILSSPEWEKLAQEEVVFVYLDFPKRKELPEKITTQNEALSEKYGIRYFPSCLLISENENGEEVVKWVDSIGQDKFSFIKRIQDAIAGKSEPEPESDTPSVSE